MNTYVSSGSIYRTGRGPTSAETKSRDHANFPQSLARVAGGGGQLAGAALSTVVTLATVPNVH